MKHVSAVPRADIEVEFLEQEPCRTLRSFPHFEAKSRLLANDWSTGPPCTTPFDVFINRSFSDDSIPTLFLVIVTILASWGDILMKRNRTVGEEDVECKQTVGAFVLRQQRGESGARS